MREYHGPDQADALGERNGKQVQSSSDDGGDEEECAEKAAVR